MTAFLLAVTLLFSGSAFPLPVGADPLPRVLAVRERILRGLIGCETVIDLTGMGLSPADVGRVYGGLLEEEPTLFHVAPRLSYAVSGEWVGAIYPVYTLTGDDLTAARAYFRETVADLLADADATAVGHPRTEAEIALQIHDLLADRYDYDCRVTGGNTDAYTLFRDGVGVCQAYAMAALSLLRGAGLEADLVTSTAMDHAWVHVRVGGAWYHMDITRDDPVAVYPDGTSGAAGEVTHTRVLRSDAGMRALGYHDFSCASGHICGDTRYERPAVLEALGAIDRPLRAISVGNGVALTWVGERRDGALAAMHFDGEGIHLHASGDMDGDSVPTPGDVLLLVAGDVPDAWRAILRKRVVEHYSATRMDISPEESALG